MTWVFAGLDASATHDPRHDRLKVF